jgi:hypothetical protein
MSQPNFADSQLTDEELAKRVQTGDEGALALLMQRFEPKLDS